MMSQSINLKLLIGALLLAASALAGLVAAWLNVRGCPGPRERRLVAFATWVTWLTVLFLFALMYVLPPPWRYLLLVPYFVGVPAYVYWVSIRRQMVRKMEQIEGESPDSGRG